MTEELTAIGAAYLKDLTAYLAEVAQDNGFVDHPDRMQEQAPSRGPLGLSIEVESSPNFYTPEQVKSRWGLTRTVEEITIHHWGGDGQHFDNVVDWLCNPTAQASAHYVAQGTNADGTPVARVARLVGESNASWANGSRAGNARSITIECRPEATERDYVVVADLIRQIRSRHGDVPIRPHRVWTSTQCPGDWDLIRLDRLSRAGAKRTCTKYFWRGGWQCSHSVPKLDLLALSTPDDFYVQLIQGAWSFGSASGNTHAGGGAGDTKGSGYSWTRMGTVETTARRTSLLLMWRRKYISGLWSQHGHYLDPECPSMSAAAQSQFALFEKGYDGLVGNNPDTGYRDNAGEIMRLFKNRLEIEPSPDTPTTTLLEGIMALDEKELEFAKEIARHVHGKGVRAGFDVVPMGQAVGYTLALTRRIEKKEIDYAALATALAPALAELLPDGPVTKDQLVEALREVLGSLDNTQPEQPVTATEPGPYLDLEGLDL